MRIKINMIRRFLKYDKKNYEGGYNYESVHCFDSMQSQIGIDCME